MVRREQLGRSYKCLQVLGLERRESVLDSACGNSLRTDSREEAGCRANVSPGCYSRHSQRENSPRSQVSVKARTPDGMIG